MEIITANELLSGASVYLDTQRAWQTDINKARIFAESDHAAKDEMIALALADGRLVSVEAEVVRVEDGKVIAHRLRERIRAEGPTAPRHEPQELKEGDHVSL